MKDKKTKLVIVTDNYDYITNGNIYENIKKIENIVEIIYMNISEYFDSVKLPEEFVACIIFNYNSLTQDEVAKLTLLIINKKIDLISTDVNNYFNELFSNPYTTKSIDEVIDCIKNEFNPKNIIVGFVTTNNIAIKRLFSNLIELMKKQEYDYKNEKFEPSIPLGFFPKLFQGWIYSVWYKTKIEVPGDLDCDPEYATVDHMITVKLPSDYTITFVWINPSINTRIIDEMDFNTLYIDIDSNYKYLTLPKETLNGTKVKIIPSIFDTCECCNNSILLNRLHNINLINEIKLINDENIELINEISKSVYGYKHEFKISGFYHIKEINPYTFYKEVIANEPEGSK